METKKRYYFASFFLFLALIFFILSNNTLGSFDKIGENYFTESIKKAAISYAAVRGVNSIVSVVKESELELSPAGVGANLAIGQILDPLDDMTERVSDVLVVAIVALGTEKLFFELINGFGFTVLSIVAAILALVPFLPKAIGENTYRFFLKFLIALLIVRLLLPISATLSGYINDTLFAGKIENSKLVLTKVTSITPRMDMEITKQEDQSIFDRVKNSYMGVEERIGEVKEIFTNIKDNMSSLIEALISLTTIYIFLFLVEVILIPLGVFFLIYKGFKGVFRGV